MVAVHLAHAVGGNVFLGFICAVAFSTILAVVAGLTLAGFVGRLARSVCERDSPRPATDREEMRVSRMTTLVLGVLAILLGIAFEKQNIAFIVSLTFSIAASSNFPGAASFDLLARLDDARSGVGRLARTRHGGRSHGTQPDCLGAGARTRARDLSV